MFTQPSLLNNKMMLKHIFLLLFTICAYLHVVAQNWQTLGNGTDFLARELYTDTLTNRLYAIGTFLYADDTVAVNNIAYWDGIKWNDLDSGNTECNSCNPIISICSFQGNIYIGGQFTSFHNVPNTQFIARYNGTNWESIGDANGPVIMFFNYNNQLYLCIIK